MKMKLNITCGLLAALSVAAAAGHAHADGLYINEILADPPSDADITSEYIEIRGTPGTVLNNYYLIGMENENGSATGTVGSIEIIFNLSGMTIGTNGYLVLLQKNSPYTNIAPGTSVYQNTGSRGWGSGTGSTIGAEDQNGDGVTENSGASYMLIKKGTGGTPYIGLDLDGGNNGLDHPFGTTTGEGRPGWTIVDNIGYFAEGADANNGRLLTKVGYGPATSGTQPAIEPGGEYATTGYGEIEYVGRYGSSTGSTLQDWVAANITDNSASGFSYDTLGTTGYLISGEHGGVLGPGEITRGSQNGIANEGTIIMTLGRANYPIPDGDLNQDGFVGQDDLNIILEHWNQTNMDLLGYWLFGDSSGDGYVGQDDLNFVLEHWNTGSFLDGAAAVYSAPDFMGVAVPEPASLGLLGLAAVGFLTRRKK